MTEEKENIYSLHQLTAYPPDMAHPVYSQYPFLKLGVRAGVLHFCNKLVPYVAEIMAANPQYKEWVLTSPPSRGVPTAANLLAQSLYEHFKQKDPTPGSISVVRFYNKSYEGAIDENAGDFKKFSGYSSYTWDERQELIRKNKFVINAADFINRGIIFINDINVTGASQHYIGQVISEGYTGKINWLYIIDCDKTVGRKFPGLEYEINNANIKTVADFATILASEAMQPTAKCLSKLFSHNIAELKQLLGMLNKTQQLRLLESIKQEELYQASIFKDKMQVIKEFVK